MQWWIWRIGWFLPSLGRVSRVGFKLPSVSQRREIKTYLIIYIFIWNNSANKCSSKALTSHDDVIKWTHFPRYWPFVTGEFPLQRPVTMIFDVFFDLRLNKRLSKQSRGLWFDAIAFIWRHCNVISIDWSPVCNVFIDYRVHTETRVKWIADICVIFYWYWTHWLYMLHR